jgi:hypothetical protein
MISSTIGPNMPIERKPTTKGKKEPFLSELAKAAMRGCAISFGLRCIDFGEKRLKRGNNDKNHKMIIVLSALNLLSGTYGLGILFLKVRRIRSMLRVVAIPSAYNIARQTSGFFNASAIVLNEPKGN